MTEVANSIETLVEYGLPDDYYDTYASRVRALQVSDIEAIAKRVVRPDNLVWVVVGDRAKIEAGIRELNLGELKLLDADGKPM
jgi:zinc protease